MIKVLDPDLAEWLTRDVPESFWETAGKIESKEQVDQLIKGIPEGYQSLAYTIVKLATSIQPTSCFIFRHLLFKIYKDLLEDGVDLKLPHYWYVDGVMIPPEFIVKITNGIVGFKCDESKAKCGMTKQECRFRED